MNDNKLATNQSQPAPTSGVQLLNLYPFCASFLTPIRHLAVKKVPFVHFLLLFDNNKPYIKRDKEGGEALDLPLSASPSILHP